MRLCSLRRNRAVDATLGRKSIEADGDGNYSVALFEWAEGLLVEEVHTMKSIRLLAVCTALTGAMAMSAPAFAAGHKCSKVSSTVTMLTTPLAAVAAQASVATSILAKGMTAKGSIKTKCDDNPLIAKCTASQKACK